TVTVPMARTPASRSASGAACGSEKSSARPGRPNQADSPVSHSETGTSLATAAAATVKAWLQRSGSSLPAVTLMTSREWAGRSGMAETLVAWVRPGPEPAGTRAGRDQGRRDHGRPDSGRTRVGRTAAGQRPDHGRPAARPRPDRSRPGCSRPVAGRIRRAAPRGERLARKLAGYARD